MRFEFLVSASLILGLISTASLAAATAMTGAAMAKIAYVTPPGFQGDDWRVTKTHWTAADEAEFSRLVISISRSNCTDVNSCIKGPHNPYYNEALERDIFLFADCGRFPLFLRMYFSWKKGLPFSFVDQKTGTPEDVQSWIEKEFRKGNTEPNLRLFPTQYTPNGNIYLRRFDIPNRQASRYRFYEIAKYMFWRIDSGNYRFDSKREMPVQSDFYPINIDKNSVRPGTTFYDPNGHIMMVSEVSPRGEIRFLDSHPDNSVSRPTFGVNHERSRPAMGPGFKNFRPVQLLGATQRPDGSLIGGQVVAIPDSQLRDFSLVQQYGKHPDPRGAWDKGTFSIEGTTVSFHEWVRLSLTRESVATNPLVQFQAELESICRDLKTRRTDIETATSQGYHTRPHPPLLPFNIHGGLTELPDWEPLSTPGRDRRARLAADGLIKNVKQSLQRAKLGSRLIDYRGANLSADLLSVAEKVDSSCTLGYKNSAGQEVSLSLFETLRRLPKMSFDHYHCPERRWGASHAQEIRTCADDVNKTAWYQAQQVFRNKLNTTPIFEEPFTLQDLQKKNAVRIQPDLDLDLEKVLRSLK